jgi:hypothetical protein
MDLSNTPSARGCFCPSGFEMRLMRGPFLGGNRRKEKFLSSQTPLGMTGSYFLRKLRGCALPGAILPEAIYEIA